MADIANTLTEAEKNFCELYVNGGPGLEYDQVACYNAAFKPQRGTKSQYQSNILMLRKDIQEYIDFLGGPSEIDDFATRQMRRKLTGDLLHIMDECKSANYVDRRGNPIPPGAMRSVAVHAAKLIADMNGIAKKTDNAGGEEQNTGITFNLVVPQSVADNIQITKEGE